MAGQYNYPVAGNQPPPQYGASQQQQQFQPGVRISQQQQGPVLAPSQPAMMMMAAPSAPLIVQQQPALEPRFNPCLCCNIIFASGGTSLRRGALFVAIGHLIHAFYAMYLWAITITARYDIKFRDSETYRDDSRIYRRLRRHQAYHIWTWTNIMAFYFPCAILILIAATRVTKLIAGTYMIWNISGTISYIVYVIVESLIVHDLGRKVYFETGEDVFVRYRSRKTIEGCIVVIGYVYFVAVGASLYHYLRDVERQQQGVLVAGAPAAAMAAPVAQMTSVYASANDNEPAHENAGG